MHEFTYYRCASQAHRCSQRDKKYMRKVVDHNVSYTQEEIEIIFQDIFKSFSFDEVTAQRMKQHLWQEHFEAKKVHGQRRERLEVRMRELENS